MWWTPLSCMLTKMLIIQNSYNSAEHAVSRLHLLNSSNVHHKPSWLLRALLFLEDFPKAPAGLPLGIRGVPGALACFHRQCKQSELKCYFRRCQISSKPLKSMRKKQKTMSQRHVWRTSWPAQSATLVSVCLPLRPPLSSTCCGCPCLRFLGIKSRHFGFAHKHPCPCLLVTFPDYSLYSSWHLS